MANLTAYRTLDMLSSGPLVGLPIWINSTTVRVTAGSVTETYDGSFGRTSSGSVGGWINSLTRVSDVSGAPAP